VDKISVLDNVCFGLRPSGPNGLIYVPKMPNMLTFWDKDASKHREFPELLSKFEYWT